MFFKNVFDGPVSSVFLYLLSLNSLPYKLPKEEMFQAVQA